MGGVWVKSFQEDVLVSFKRVSGDGANLSGKDGISDDVGSSSRISLDVRILS